MSFDIIGDIHGQADKLQALLKSLGYSERWGSWHHPGRMAIFVGDFIDRGPAQLRTLNIVRRMVDEGQALAVMGNHELNAIAWHTPDPARPGEYLRPRFSPKWGTKNRLQHERFLAEVEHDPTLHANIIAWFMKLPLYLDLPAIRIVHACWHQRFMDWLGPHLNEDSTLTAETLIQATLEPINEVDKDDESPSVFKAVEALTKGIEIPLPDGYAFLDKDGIERRRVRIRWWAPEANTFRLAAMVAEEMLEALPNSPIPDHAQLNAPTDKPIFFGHYWLTGTPRPLSARAACVDFSAGKSGPLVAYRWDGESILQASKFHYI